MDMQRIISKHQHTDGLIALFPQHQMSGNVSYDFGPLQNHGTLSNVSSRYSGPKGHFMNASGYDGKIASYNDIYSAGLANPNLLLNGGFETAGAGGADIWADWAESVGDGALANEAVLIHTGADACKITAGAGVNTRVAQSNRTAIPGVLYRYWFYTRGDGVNEGRYRVYDQTNALDIISTTGTGVPGTAYTKVDVEFTAPAGCVKFGIYFYCPATNGGVAYFDTASARRTVDFGFDADAGAIISFVKTDAAWAEGTDRYIINLEADANNKIQAWKSSTHGRLYFRYESNGDAKVVSIDGMTTMDWFCVGIMWDRLVNDEVRIFLDGVDTDGGVGLGTWFGNLAATKTVIGASENDGSDCWDGGIGVTAIYNAVKTDAEMLYLSKP